MIDAVLVMCPKMYYSFEHKYGPSLSLAYLKPAFEQAGISVKCLDPVNDEGLKKKGLEGLIRSIREYDPCAVGISSVSCIWDSLLAVAGRIKVATGKPIIVGGYISIIPEIMKMTSAIDVLFTGEGEVRGPDVFKAFRPENIERRYELLSAIPGLLIRTQNNELFETSPAPFIENINDLQPDLTDIIRVDTAFLYASRGCYARCSFCYIRDHIGKKVRRVAGHKLSEIIRVLAEDFDIKLIHFYDDNFLHSREEQGRIDEIAPTLRKYGISIEFQTRAQDVIRRRDEIIRNRDVIAYVQVGVESFIARQLNDWKKGITPEQNLESIRILNSLGINYRALLIMLDGKTTKEEIQENIEHFLSLTNNNLPYVLTTFSGQSVPAHPLMNKWEEDDLTTDEQRKFADVVYQITGLNIFQEYLETFRREKLFSASTGSYMPNAKRLMGIYRDVAILASHALYVSAAEVMYEGERGAFAEKNNRELRYYMYTLERESKLIEDNIEKESELEMGIFTYSSNLIRAHNLSKKILIDAKNNGWKLPINLS